MKIGDRIYLRNQSLSDVEDLYKILSDPEVMLHYPSTYSYEDTKKWIKRNIASYQAHGFGLWAVVLKKTDLFIGQCGISYQKLNEEALPEIGFHIDKNYWNKGLGYEAAKLAYDYGIDNLKLPFISIITSTKNIPARRIAEKLGMSPKMNFIKHFKTGRRMPHILYLNSCYLI